MIYRHPRFTAHVAEQRLCSRIPSAHRTSPNISSRSRNYRHILATISTFFRTLLILLSHKTQDQVFEIDSSLKMS